MLFPLSIVREVGARSWIRRIILVEAVLFYVVYHHCGQQISDRESPSQEQSDLCTGDIVLNELRYHVDIIPPSSQAICSLIHPRPSAFYDESAVATQYVVEVGMAPDTRLAHGADQVGACEQHDMDIPVLSLLCMDTSEYGIDFVIEVVQDDRSTLVGLERFPVVNHQP